MQGSGYAALHWCALNANAKMARLLLSLGADVSMRHKSVGLPRPAPDPSTPRPTHGAGGAQGNTPLHYAALDAHPDVARVLIEAGADLEAANNVRHPPAPHFARGRPTAAKPCS